jgi:hypothetical protein
LRRKGRGKLSRRCWSRCRTERRSSACSRAPSEPHGCAARPPALWEAGQAVCPRLPPALGRRGGVDPLLMQIQIDPQRVQLG